jgi:CubicO group peptidase (beta-lactamase class C family)
MSKSVCAALIGVAVREGRLALTSNALLPEWRAPGDPRAAITLDQLLRMTSGLAFSEDYGDPLADVVLMLFTQADGSLFAARKPLAAPPGARWHYSSGDTAILARVLRLALGGTAAEHAAFPRRALFDPIGMHSAVLEVDASGTLQTSSFVYASPHDWARFGQFLLQDGVWNGRRLLPEGWVRYLTTLTPSSQRRNFGAHLWVRVPEPFNSTQQPEPPQIPSDAFHLTGYDGQLTSIVPSREMVVVRLGLSRNRRAWDHETFLARVLNAAP